MMEFQSAMAFIPHRESETKHRQDHNIAINTRPGNLPTNR